MAHDPGVARTRVEEDDAFCHFSAHITTVPPRFFLSKKGVCCTVLRRIYIPRIWEELIRYLTEGAPLP